MPNGHGPPVYILSNTDYNTIKNGSCVTRGDYAGCIYVLGAYYWVSAPDSGEYWDLNSGMPDATQVAISSSVWSLCEDGGTYDWVSKDEWWNDPVGGEDYRWGDLDGTVVMVEV